MASSVSFSPRTATRNRAGALFVIATLGFQMLGFATPVTAAESAPAHAPRAAQNDPIPPVTITLVSGGGSGDDGSVDPAVTYSIPTIPASGGARIMPQHAYPVCGGSADPGCPAYAAPITGTRWINSSGTGLPDAASGVVDGPTKTAIYAISFVLPPSYSSPTITVGLMSDNCAIASLNNTEVGRQSQDPC
ncbi:MAG: hypothetical protein ABI573_03665, partial [Chloroflexota bacterium]